MARKPPAILWDIFEEHLEEAAFLWCQWEDALLGASYTLPEVVSGPEERLRAHLDALVSGGARVAEELLLPALADADTGKVSAAAWSLLHAEDADQFDNVFAALREGEPAARSAVGRAFELAERADVVARLEPAWDGGDALVQGVILDVVASHVPGRACDRLGECLASTDSLLLAPAIRAARRAPEARFVAAVEQALESRDPAVRYEAIATGLVLHAPALPDACRREAPGQQAAFRLSLALQILHARKAVQSRLESLLADPELRPHAVWALGFGGDIAAAERLISLLADDDVAPLAGEALSAITGVAIAGPLERPREPQGPTVDEVEPDGPLPSPRVEDELPMPDAAAVAKWWQRAREKLPGGGVALLYGRERTPESIRELLAGSATMWRRPVLALELASARRTGVQTDVRGWARSSLRPAGSGPAPRR